MCVTWTPDSKGFYFTAGKDYKKLLYFDVAAKKARTVVADFNGMTHWPAVSPDGKRVAVVTFVRDDQKYGSQVVVYDSAGRELQRSRLAPPATQPPKSVLVCLFWAPKDQGDRILFQARNTCALVDLKADRFTDMGEQTMLWVIGNSPIRLVSSRVPNWSLYAHRGATRLARPSFPCPLRHVLVAHKLRQPGGCPGHWWLLADINAFKE
jgi:hypothetical protein